MYGLWIFNLPRDVSVTDLSSRLGAPERVRVRGPLRGRRERLDTFDWRLHHAGITLEYELAAGIEPRLRLLDPGSPAGVIEVRAPDRPGAVESLPSAILRRRLAPIMGVRALLPRHRMAGRLFEVLVCDRRDKAVVRLHLWRPSRRGDCVLRVQAVRGYQPQARRVIRQLGKKVSRHALERDPLWLDVADGGAPVGNYPSWDVSGLAGSQRTDDAVQQALMHYRSVMDLNLPGLRADLDSEFLHDFRVGLRRSRTLIRRIPDVFPDRTLSPFREDLGWLSAVTGPPRDAHVHCLVFADYAAGLDSVFSGALEPLFDHVRRVQVESHQDLVEALDSARFRRRWAAWNRFLERPMSRNSRQKQGPLPLDETAGPAVQAAVRRMLRQGGRIKPSSVPTKYHDLRKSGKDLRYLLDVLGNVLDAGSTRKMLRPLKKLQTLLGEHQDLDVHREALQTIHRDMASSGSMDGETHAAMEHLVKELALRSANLRKRFPRRFEALLSACPRRLRSGRRT